MILAFEFNFAVLISFLIGIFLGLALAVLVYLIVVLSTMHNKKFIVQTKVSEVSENDILNLIENAKIQFKDEKLRGDTSYFSYAYDISKNLVISIAQKFYPNSKHPLLEISVDELLMLFVYISKRLDEILDHKGLRFLRKFKISYFVGLYDIKEDINNNEIIKKTKKYKVKEAFNAARKVVNLINPVWWVRKFVMNKAMKIVTKKLCVVVISICGEETYKIYSKSIYSKDVLLDSGVDNLVSDLEDTVEKEKDELISEEEQKEYAVYDFSNGKVEEKKNKFSFKNLFKRKGK